MIKTRDILPKGCSATYYPGKGKVVFLDQFGIREVLVETELTVPLIECSETEIANAKKVMDRLLPDADEEWSIEAGHGLIGLFRYSH